MNRAIIQNIAPFRSSLAISMTIRVAPDFEVAALFRKCVLSPAMDDGETAQILLPTPKGTTDMNLLFVRATSPILLTLGILAGMAPAQDRESLRNPVYRLNNSTNPAPVDHIAVASPSPVPETSASSTKPTKRPEDAQPASTDKKTDQELAKQEALVEPVGKMAKHETLAGPVNVPVADPIKDHPSCVALNCALTDARDILTHIKTNIRDYTCDFVKRERINGVLSPVERIELKVRNRVMAQDKVDVPFAVYMKYKSPKEVRNREILYIEGENNNKVLAKEGGMRGKWLPSVWLRPDGAFAMKSSRYPISQVGIQRLTERLVEGAECNDSAHLCKIRYVKGAKVNGRSCSFLEVIREERRPGPLGPNNIYVAHVFIDEELRIPIRYAAYDWPEVAGGKAVILEEYTYNNIKLNVGLTKKDFDHNNSKYNF